MTPTPPAGAGSLWLSPDILVPVVIGLLACAGFGAVLAAALFSGRDRVRRRPGTEDRRAPAARAAETDAATGPVIAGALSTGLLAGTVIALALCLLLPLPPTDRALLAVVLWPVFAAAAPLYPAASRHRRRAHLWLLAASGAVAIAGTMRWIF